MVSLRCHNYAPYNIPTKKPRGCAVFLIFSCILIILIIIIIINKSYNKNNKIINKFICLQNQHGYGELE